MKTALVWGWEEERCSLERTELQNPKSSKLSETQSSLLCNNINKWASLCACIQKVIATDPSGILSISWELQVSNRAWMQHEYHFFWKQKNDSSPFAGLVDSSSDKTSWTTSEVGLGPEAPREIFTECSMLINCNLTYEKWLNQTV